MPPPTITMQAKDTASNMLDLFSKPDARTTIILPSGFTLDLMEPDATDMPIEDIAVSLSKQMRWAGATKVPYSVAEHAVMCSYLVPKEHAFDALHHDDEEFMGDDITPKKTVMAIKAVREFFKVVNGHPAFAGLQGFRLDQVPQEVLDTVLTKDLLKGFYSPIKNALAKEFGFRTDLHVVKQADLVCMATEKRDLLPPSWMDWSFLPAPHKEKVKPLKTSAEAAERYLERHYELSEKDR